MDHSLLGLLIHILEGLEVGPVLVIPIVFMWVTSLGLLMIQHSSHFLVGMERLWKPRLFVTGIVVGQGVLVLSLIVPQKRSPVQ